MKSYPNIKICLCFVFLSIVIPVNAQNIPIPLSYSTLYDFLDELTVNGIINTQSIIKPYSRIEISKMLHQALEKDSLLNATQKKDLYFYKNSLALEQDTIPDLKVQYTNKKTFSLSLFNPAFLYMTKNKKVKIAIEPILGAKVLLSKKGAILERRWGAELRIDLFNHISLWGSIRDISYYGKLLKSKYFPTNEQKIEAAKLSLPDFLTNTPGCQYKEASYGADYSDVKSGIVVYDWYGSIGIIKENIQWGDAYHCSNILSGRNPSTPQLSLQLTPCYWFRFNYFHAWLVSNTVDSSQYYIENTTKHITQKEYRPKNKFMAANMFTFLPCKYLHFSFGNSILYAENTPKIAYFIPFAFYKSLDHLFTKGTATQNQNSQFFFSLSLFPVQHLKLYSSLFFDDFQFNRLKKSSKERNPISYIVGFNWSGWPIKRLSLKVEFSRSYIATYNHSIDALTYTSNSFLLGHYMGDNAQSIYLELTYKPLRGLLLKLNLSLDTKYNSYHYLRTYRNKGEIVREGDIAETLSQKPFNKKIFTNKEINFLATYEFFPNMFAELNFMVNAAKGFDNTTSTSTAEYTATAHDYLTKFFPSFYNGKNFTVSAGIHFNF